jgi:hypothetical protein
MAQSGSPPPAEPIAAPESAGAGEQPAARSELSAPVSPPASVPVVRQPRMFLDGQRPVLQAMLEGKSILEASQITGVPRTTIYRWLKSDDLFQSNYNKWQEVMEESCRFKLLSMADKAAEAIGSALSHNDSRAAFQLLQGLGLICPSGPRLTDTADLKKRNVLDEHRRKMLLAEESLSPVTADPLPPSGRVRRR